MAREAVINSVLSEQGYSRVSSMLFRLTNSNDDVEHLFSYSFWGADRAALRCDFGFLNNKAEDFAIRCVRLYGGPVYRHSKWSYYTMSFSFGKLAGWDPRSSLWFPMSDDVLAERVRTGLQTKLFPLIKNASDLKGLFCLLCTDVEPFRWLYVNGAIRVAQICWLAKKMHLDDKQMYELISSYKAELGASLVRGIEPQEYITNIIAEVEKPD